MEKTLYAAVKSGNLEELRSLKNDELQQTTPTKNTALHVAAYHGHVQAVETLLELMNRDIEASREFLTARNDEGNTALHEAAIGGHHKVVEFFLEHHGELLSIVNNAGETALFKAAEEGHKKIVEDLLGTTESENGKRTSDGQTLVQCAVYKTRKSILKKISLFFLDSNPLNAIFETLAAYNEYLTNCAGVLKKLITANPELLQQVDNLGRTPLHSAAYLNGISRIAKILLEKDRSLCYKVDDNGQSALHLAVKEGNLELATEILNYAEDCIEIVDNDGRTALHLVVENAEHTFHIISRRIKSLLLLVTSKRLINKPDKLGKTALDIAIDNMSSDERLFYGVSSSFDIILYYLSTIIVININSLFYMCDGESSLIM